MTRSAPDPGTVRAPDTPGRADLGVGWRVLVVDDEAGVRDLLRRWLHALGFEVLSAASATEALELLDPPLAVALCDIRMPERDGFWLAEQIRRLSPATALVIASGMQDVGSAVTGLRHGVVDYLMKPFGRDRLREAMQRAIDWHAAALALRRGVDTRNAGAGDRLRRLREALVALGVDSDERLEGALKLLTLSTPDGLEHARRLRQRAVATARHLDLPGEAEAHLGRAVVLGLLLECGVAESSPATGPVPGVDGERLRQAALDAPELFADMAGLVGAARVLAARFACAESSGGSQEPPPPEIQLAARVLAVVDSFDRYVRCHRGQPAIDQVTAPDVDQATGARLDPVVIAAFCAVSDGDTPFVRR